MANEFANSAWVGWAGTALSVAVHAVTFVALGAVDPGDAVLKRDVTVELTVIDDLNEVKAPEPEVAPAPVAPEPAPEPIKPAPRPKPAAVAPKEPVAAPPENAPPPPAEETIADFTGTTLVGAGEGGWVSAVGSGAPMDKPIGKAGALVTGRDRAGVAGGVPDGTAMKIVPLADLSRRPSVVSPEAWDEALVRAYPKDAKLQGIEGMARVKIRIMPNGKAQVLATVSETYQGFGEACRVSLRDVRFEPALDRAGQPTATEMVTKCTFETY